MTIILNQYPIPEPGTFEIHQVVTFHVSAEEARRTVARWLRREVSHLLGADAPVLIVGEPTQWRIPVHFSLPHIGVMGHVGDIHVNALSGELLDLAASQKQIEAQAKALATTAPPFQPHTKVPPAYMPNDVPRAPKLAMHDDEPVLSESETSSNI